MPRQISRLMATMRQKRRGEGFTIVEVLIAFVVLIMVITGLTTAMTASMRLGTIQKQRNIAQVTTRNVISRYLKNEDYNAIVGRSIDATSGMYGFNNDFAAHFNCSGVNCTCNPATASSGSPCPAELNLFKITSGVLNYDNLDDLSLTSLKTDLNQLSNPWLKLTMSSIKKDDGTFYDSKVNVVINLSWRDHSTPRSVEQAVVIGTADVTRAKHAAFVSPTTPPTPAPTAVPTASASIPVGSATPTATPTPTPTPTASTCLPFGASCGNASTCNSSCCSHNHDNDMGNFTCL